MVGARATRSGSGPAQSPAARGATVIEMQHGCSRQRCRSTTPGRSWLGGVRWRALPSRTEVSWRPLVPGNHSVPRHHSSRAGALSTESELPSENLEPSREYRSVAPGVAAFRSSSLGSASASPVRSRRCCYQPVGLALAPPGNDQTLGVLALSIGQGRTLRVRWSSPSKIQYPNSSSYPESIRLLRDAPGAH